MTHSPPAADAAPAIAISRLNKRRGAFHALRDIDLAIPPEALSLCRTLSQMRDAALASQQATA